MKDDETCLPNNIVTSLLIISSGLFIISSSGNIKLGIDKTFDLMFVFRSCLYFVCHSREQPTNNIIM